jgi:putative flippase GtrA
MLNIYDISAEKFPEVHLFYYVIEIIGVSILVSLFAGWIGLIPRYTQKKYYVFQELLNAAILAVFLTIVFMLKVYPGWIILFLVILLITWLSIRLTNIIVQRSAGSDDSPTGTESRNVEQ